MQPKCPNETCKGTLMCYGSFKIGQLKIVKTQSEIHAIDMLKFKFAQITLRGRYFQCEPTLRRYQKLTTRQRQKCLVVVLGTIDGP